VNQNLEGILNSHRTGTPVIMGILNVTPDSFSDGGQYVDPKAAVHRAGQLISSGADILDIGAESTRPGSARVPADQQIGRLENVLPEICRIASGSGVQVSIDTTLPSVAEFALDAGATIINDVSAGRENPGIMDLAAGRTVPFVLMHMLGTPATMQSDPVYNDVLSEVRQFLSDRLDAAVAAGIDRDKCIVDPGIGFGKTLEHNLCLLSNIAAFCTLGCPVLVGPSRKRFIGELTSVDDPSQRTGGTIAACLACFRQGATIFRVHDVSQVRQAFVVTGAIGG